MSIKVGIAVPITETIFHWVEGRSTDDALDKLEKLGYDQGVNLVMLVTSPEHPLQKAHIKAFCAHYFRNADSAIQAVIHAKYTESKKH